MVNDQDFPKLTGGLDNVEYGIMQIHRLRYLYFQVIQHSWIEYAYYEDFL